MNNLALIFIYLVTSGHGHRARTHANPVGSDAHSGHQLPSRRLSLDSNRRSLVGVGNTSRRAHAGGIKRPLNALTSLLMAAKPVAAFFPVLPAGHAISMTGRSKGIRSPGLSATPWLPRHTSQRVRGGVAMSIENSPVDRNASSANRLKRGAVGTTSPERGRRDKVKGASLREWGLLAKLSQPDVPLLAAASASLALSAAGEAFKPKLQAAALNAALGLHAGSSLSALNAVLLRLSVVSILTGAFAGARGYLFGVSGMRLVSRLRQKLFGALLRQPQAFHDTKGPGELSSRLATDVDKLGDVLSLTLNVLARQVIQCTLAMVILFRTNAKLASMVLGGVIVRGLYGRYYAKVFRALATAAQNALAQSSGVVEQCMSLIRLVRSYGNEQYEAQRYTKKLDELFSLKRKQIACYGQSLVLNNFLNAGVYVAVFSLGGMLVAAGTLSPEELTTFVLYVGFVSLSSVGISGQWVRAQEALGASSTLFDYLEPRAMDGTVADAEAASAPPSGKPTQGGAERISGRLGELVFEDVNFTYPSQPDRKAVEGLSFSVHAGERVVIIGGSGSGKSTILNLAQHFYQPTDGKVAFGGKPLDRIDEHDLRQRVAWVQQEPPLLPDATIRENIAYGQPDVPDEKIEAAAKEANAYEFIQEMPDGFDTRITAAGSSLSAGQKQRVALARAFLREPELLLLDEPTSALDPGSERLIEEAIQRASKGCAVLYTTHKVSQAKRADRIIVMSRGRVVEQGTHEELLQKGGAYVALLNAGDGMSQDATADIVESSVNGTRPD